MFFYRRLLSALCFVMGLRTLVEGVLAPALHKIYSLSQIKPSPWQTTGLIRLEPSTGQNKREEDEGIIEVPRSGTPATTIEDAEVLYFAYGTNMLEKRLRIKCPEAKFFGAALLKNHRLDFTMEAPWWNGAVATICNDPGADVWGVIWIVKVIDMDKLDEQEGVSAGWYHPKEVTVIYKGDRKLKAITYVQNHSPRKINPLDNYPPERQPSLTYLKVMILGAIQGRLPDDYIQFLYTIPNNGKVASQELIDRFMHSSKNTKLLL